MSIKTYSQIIESFESIIAESAAPGMEDWVKENKKQFIDQYGKEKGLNVLYATSWKLHDKKVNESLDEDVMDNIRHPKYGKIEWRNDGGAHNISTTSKETGAQVIHALGTHKEIAQKWAKLKEKLLKEDTEWVELGGTNQIIEGIVEDYKLMGLLSESTVI